MDEIDAMVLEARRVVAEAPDASPEEMIAVGGTASNLLRVLPGTVSDGILTSRRVTIALAMLSEETSAATAAVTNLNALSTVHAGLISTINAYTPTGAFETAAKDEMAKLTSEFTSLRSKATTATTGLSAIDFTV